MQRIVLVDEDAERHRDATEALNTADYQVTVCREPDAAFACVCQAQADVVIVAMPMAVRRACSLLNQLKQQEETAAIPVLVNWPPGTLLPEDRRTFEERGVYLLSQPLPAEELQRCIAAATARPESPRRMS